MKDLRNWERPMEWALGNVDEAMFTFSTALQQLKRKPYLSDPAQLAELTRPLEMLPAVEEVFVQPPRPEVKLTPARFPRTTAELPALTRPYRVYTLEYPSAITTGFEANDTVRGYYLERNDNENGPAVIYLHGWLEFDPGLSLRLPLEWLAPPGFNILALHLPFHFGRAPKGTISGELSIMGNLPLLIKGTQQSVSDVRQALYWLKERHSSVGIVGKSLGGLVEAMALAAESAFAAAALLVPATSTRDIIWRSGYTRLLRRDLLLQGLDEETTARLLEIVRPGRYQPAIDPQRILLFKARADRVCFPGDTDLFARAWGVPVVEVPTGHLTSTLHPRMRQATQAHFKQFLR